MNINNVHDPNWYVDIGANAHMTNDPGTLISCSSYKGNDKFFVGDGEALDISHTGNVILQTCPSKIELQNVLVVLEIKKSLLFVRQLSTDDSCMFEFSCPRFKIKEQDILDKVLATGSRLGDLYSLDLSNPRLLLLNLPGLHPTQFGMLV